MKGTAKATLNTLRISPRKVRLLVDLIRGTHVTSALSQLMVAPKHAARPIAKLLQSAIANGVNNHNLDEKTLVIKTATVDGGPILYRSIPKAFGKATPIRKRSSHITLILEGEVKSGKTAKTSDEKIETVEKTDEIADATIVEKKTKVIKKKKEKSS